MTKWISAIARKVAVMLGDSPSVLDFGAVADLAVFTGGIAASSTSLISTTSIFVVEDIGKSVSIPGAGAAGIALNTTIVGWTSGTTVTVAATASTTVTGQIVAYGTDLSAAITAALSSNTSRKPSLKIPPGNYYAASKIEITQPLRLYGAGPDVTTIYVAPRTTGIAHINGQAGGSTVENFSLISLSTAAGTDDGIVPISNGVMLKNIYIQGFGRHGVNHDSFNNPGNANSQTWERVYVLGTWSHGFFRQGPDSNQSTSTACSARLCRGYGFYTDHVDVWISFNSTHVGFHAEGNYLGAVYENGSQNQYLNLYTEPDGPTGTCNTSGTVVTRVTGPSYSADIIGWKAKINNVLYDVVAVPDADHLTLGTSAGTQTGVNCQPWINQVVKFGPYAQYGTFTVDSEFLNGCVFRGYDNGTHWRVQKGNVLNRLGVSGVTPQIQIQDKKQNPIGICNTSGTAVTRVSGDVFAQVQEGTQITISGVSYYIDTFINSSQITLRTSAGTQTGVAYEVQMSRLYQIYSGQYSDGALSIADYQATEDLLVYQRINGWVALKDFRLQRPVPILRMSDTTPTTGKTMSFRNGFRGTSQFTLSHDSGAGDVLVYDCVNEKFFFLAPAVFNAAAVFQGGVNIPVLTVNLPAAIDGSGNITSRKIDVGSSSDVTGTGLNTNRILYWASPGKLATAGALTANVPLTVDGAGVPVSRAVDLSDGTEVQSTGMSALDMMQWSGGGVVGISYASLAALLLPFLSGSLGISDIAGLSAALAAKVNTGTTTSSAGTPAHTHTV